MALQNKINSADEMVIKQAFAKHFPDETSSELLGRMQSLLTFVNGLPKPLLDADKLKILNAIKTQIDSHQPVMLHQFKKSTQGSTQTYPTHPEKQVITTLLDQITKLEKVMPHLEPAQRIKLTRDHP